MFSLSGKGILKGGVALLLVIAAVITYTIIFRGEEEVFTPKRISKRIKIEPLKTPSTQPLQETADEENVIATPVSEIPLDKKEITKEAKESSAPQIVKPEGVIPPEELKTKPEKDIEPGRLTKKTQSEKQEGLEIKQKAIKVEEGLKAKPKEKVAYKPKDWAINISSRASEEEALELTQRLKEKGYNAYVTRFESKEGSIWYRVRVGFFASEEEAKDMAQRIAREFSLEGYWWIVKPSHTEIDRFSKG